MIRKGEESLLLKASSFEHFMLKSPDTPDLVEIINRLGQSENIRKTFERNTQPELKIK